MATVLIVDWCPHARVILRDRLKASGYQVAEATDSRGAFVLLAYGGIDLIITGLGIDGIVDHSLGGVEFIRIVRSNPDWARTPIIVCSAHVMEVFQDNSLIALADAYLGKPVSPRAVAEKVRQLLGEHVLGAERSPQ